MRDVTEDYRKACTRVLEANEANDEIALADAIESWLRVAHLYAAQLDERGRYNLGVSMCRERTNLKRLRARLESA